MTGSHPSSPVRTVGGLGLAALLLTACTSTSGEASHGSSGTVASGSTGRHQQSHRQHTWVVTLGDSYISGEGARWGANTSGPARRVDALGPDAYFDGRGQERHPGCHRAEQSIATLGGDLRGVNLACSGAKTTSDTSGVRFKPGLDFFHERGVGVGQALALERFATRHVVRDVVVSIGGNDFGFGALAGRCIQTYLSSRRGTPQLCQDDRSLAVAFGRRHQGRVQARITRSLDRLATAMKRAGYDDEDYRLLVLTYPSPVPPGPQLRYGEQRATLGGCPLFAADATWANETVLPRINDTVRAAARRSGLDGLAVVDLSRAFVGHRLCELGTRQLSETRLPSWHADGAVDRVEWVNSVYLSLAPWQVQESLHPVYWGMAAERACVRLAIDETPAASYQCVGTGGLRHGEPAMKLH